VEVGCRGGYVAGGEMNREWGKCDLKAGHERSSSSAFDRTYVRSTALVPGASGAKAFAFELTG
jgi:hypothetical protein